VSCGYSKEILALYVEDDLPTTEAIGKVASHVSACPACRRYCEELRKNQSFIKSHFSWENGKSVTQETLAGVRRNVMSQIDAVQQSLGWALKLERFFMLGLRRHRYAAAGMAFFAIVSASILGQIQRPVQNAGQPAAQFVGRDTLLCPTNYRGWVFVGCSLGAGHARSESPDMYHNVYMNPAAYHEYSRSGIFPEGTVMVLETFSVQTTEEPGVQGAYEKDLAALEVSVKDSGRFDGGWGYYDFSESAGKLKREAEPLPQTAGCFACHRDKGATDHVFTQFYPVLKGIGS
jgi:hypothetical protein